MTEQSLELPASEPGTDEDHQEADPASTAPTLVLEHLTTADGLPQATVTVWYSMVGPAHLPPEVSERLRKEIAAVLADPTVRAKLEKLGSSVAPLYGDAFEKQVVEDFKLWKQIGKDENIVLD
jgi:tripartite-type tricarboxylate transporter receptor subunit TctC